MIFGRGSPSLLWKILLSTSIAITALFAATGWFVHDQTLAALSRSLRREVESSFRAYELLWQSRADTLRSVSLVLSSMSDVRAAFGTRDGATIRDTAGEIWSRLSQSNAVFLVCDPSGGVIASLGGGKELGSNLQVVRDSAPKFPSQTEGFALQGDRLFELVTTPVYVDTGAGPGLLNVLVAGFPVDETLAQDLGRRTGSDFVFIANGHPVASTLPREVATALAGSYRRSAALQRVRAGDSDYAVLSSPLRDPRGQTIGDLLIVGTFKTVEASLGALERELIAIWAGAIALALIMSYVLAGRILKPVRELDQAAARISQQEYGMRVPEGADDELGRLARTFNSMCESIQQAREELIRQERISTIGRLSSSIVHDLRNPLAAIYGGAEMLIDGDLNEAHQARVAANLYRASRTIKDMLQELVDVSRGRMQPPELCGLSEVLSAARDTQAEEAAERGVEISIDVEPGLELPLERARVERVFINLIANALEAMPEGGKIEISAHRNGASAHVTVADTGPGIPPDLRQTLFQPFARSSKSGLGLGLALSRQTVLDHGGDLWVDTGSSRGARFHLRFPLQC